MKKIAFITGICGQDGAYLAKLLVDKNYKVEFGKFDFDKVKKIMLEHDFSEERIESQFDKIRDLEKSKKQRTLF